MQELFRQNAYGDTWQEPELFDQPATVATLPAEGDRVHIVAGPYVDRFGSVDWIDADGNACVELQPRNPWEGTCHLVFTPAYFEAVAQ